jgi:2-hydroxychromene-2-carboxylate isomerase
METGTTSVDRIDFYFDPMCPWAYQTSLWIRDVRKRRPLAVHWRFFSLEEINRPDGKRHPWERTIAYGWTPLRIAAWLRRDDMAMCDRWYEAAGQALHVDGRRPYDESVAKDLLTAIGSSADVWDQALGDPTTHDDVRADHDHAVSHFGAFGVPILVLPNDRAVFGPVVLPAPQGAEADALWDVVSTFSQFPGLFELKAPKSAEDMGLIARTFQPYLSAREWQTIQHPAP